MDKINVLVSARFTQEQINALAGAHPRIVLHGGPGGIALAPAEGEDIQEISYPEWHPELDLDALLKDMDAMIAFRVPDDIKQRAPKLKWVAYTAAGVDHVWTDKLAATDLIFTNASGIHPIPMAEFVMSMVLLFAKRWLQLREQQQAKVWKRFIMDELYERTIGIIGFGKIGREVARRARAFGMHVLYQDVAPAPAALEQELGAEYCTLPDLLRRADFVALHAPLTPTSYHMINADMFKLMKPTAYFINCARGKVVDEPALIAALQSGQIAGAGLDVAEEEPPAPDNPLWTMPNVVLSPHMGGDTARYMERATAIFVENLRRYAAGEPLLNVVDHSRWY